ncbi:transglycosylase SLT domain-containing protein [Tabrizicola sp.]|uniref:transglycosylase SLT domain-containing protein n=1 Tax=Tabrizicola sp. TaxID=2005166 RepID=UPI00260FDF10|nr:transglycosylase SLT domain-containing protein [Tabrizicola sp.]MDM7931817.1 transglycosylase SLT domain-containing protein [Tabrizicola sp.]
MPQSLIIRSIRYSVIAMLLLSSAGSATTDAANLCLLAATEAAKRSGVPQDVLLAVALVETGRHGRPWPWTINLGGEGHWLESARAAENLVADAIDAGLTNIDLGCFQLNYRWHAEAFTSIADMLDPDRNAAYAADYLAQHHADTGDWSAAAAAYHSATPEHAERYRARFEAVLADLGGGAGFPIPKTAQDRTNSFPLLVAGQSGSRGSLVPATAGSLRLIGGT